ncbi:MAG: SH3-like domain-containing protein [Bacteroidales bacterium]|nr:SH3-like domain-containing protein [Bacteroidales bacterium]
MKLDIKLYAFLLSVIALMGACQSNSSKKVDNLSPNAHQVVAEEIIQTSKYTYVLVSEDEKGYWIAISKADVNEDGTYFWSVGSEMNNFTSNELKRTFPSIFFVQDFTDQPILEDSESPMPVMGTKPQIREQEGMDIPKAEGGITIAELFADPNSFQGKTVKINGMVVKFLPEIMDRNWVHLQDGTKDGENYDLTITTSAIVKPGEIVTFEGVVVVDKDFGAGYFYNVILEDGVVK